MIFLRCVNYIYDITFSNLYYWNYSVFTRGDIRIAVLVNEVGEVDIDSRYLNVEEVKATLFVLLTPKNYVILYINVQPF